MDEDANTVKGRRGADILRKIIKGLSGLAVSGGCLYLSGVAEGLVSGFEEAREKFLRHTVLPSCDSSHGKSDARRAIENSPWAKNGIAVVGVSATKTLSANSQKVECSATVILNSAQKGMMNYSFTADPSLEVGQYYIKSSLDADSFTPYP